MKKTFDHNSKTDDRSADMAEGASLKRVGLFIDNYFPIVDGVVRTVDNYALGLEKRGIKATVLCPRYKVYDDSDKSYTIWRASSFRVGKFEYAIPNPKFTKGLKRRIMAEEFSLFHAHSPFFMGRYGMKIAHKKQIPIVATFHSKFYDDFLQITKMKWLARLLTRYVVRFFERCDEVWAVNESTKETLLSYGYKGKTIRVMPNGTHFDYPKGAQALRTRMRERFEIPEDMPVLLFVGHLIWQKNLRVILDSLKILVDQGFAFKMLFVGEGGNSKAVQAYAEKLNLQPYVSFLGSFKVKEELQEIYAGSDLFYFPSVYDNAPLVLREASVMKLPALLAKGSNSAEKTVDGVNGFVAEPVASKMAERILAIFAHRDELPAIGQQASVTIPVSWDEVIKQVEIDYQDLINRYQQGLTKHKS